MSVGIPIRGLIALRPAVKDQTLLDYLDLTILCAEPGKVATTALRNRWQCSQPQVSRRLAAIQQAGLAHITRGAGWYSVHAVKEWEVKL